MNSRKIGRQGTVLGETASCLLRPLPIVSLPFSLKNLPLPLYALKKWWHTCGYDIMFTNMYG